MSRKVWWSGAWVDLGGGGGMWSPLTDGVVSASSSWTTGSPVADAATPHADGGAWVEVDASLSADAGGVIIQLFASTFVSGADTSTLLEIGTGGAGAETVWATVPVGYRVAYNDRIAVPGFIASGTRVAVRCRSVTLSKVVQARFVFYSGSATAAPQTYGVNTAASNGTGLTAPGSLNTKSAWTEITASTSAAISELMVGIQGNTGAAMTTSTVLVDIGVGAASSETVVVSDLFYVTSSSEAFVGLWETVGVSIPAGSRIAARYARASANNAVDLILVGA